MIPKSLGLLAFAAVAALTLAGCAGTTPTETDEPAPTPTGAASNGSPAPSPTAAASNAAVYGSATGGTLDAKQIKQAGSSTVFPLAEAWAEDFGGHRRFQMAVGGGGSSLGASGLCNKEHDLGDMSRRMTQAEIDLCKSKGVNPVEWKVAYDGLSVVVGKDNTFLKDISVSQLSLIFRKEGFAKKWNEVDPSYPATEIRLCFPDAASGTYEYFNEVILNKAAPRNDAVVQQSADDDVLVRCLESDGNAVGYFGYAYVVSNAGKVHAVKVNGVTPSFQSIEDGTYTPLSRFLYIYTNGKPQGVLRDYFGYVYNASGGQSLVQGVGYVALDSATREAMVAQLNA